MHYIWDTNKNILNIRKHHIDFADVPDMFNYPMLTCIDLRKDYGEERWVGIGFLKGMIAVVVFTENNQTETIRILSARKATKHESQQFKEKLAV
jgi:hypothetical protein